MIYGTDGVTLFLAIVMVAVYGAICVAILWASDPNRKRR